MRALFLVLVGLLVCLAGCQLLGIDGRRTDCHPMAVSAPASVGWRALGDGPVYPVYPDAPWDHSIYVIDRAGNTQGWYELKVAWVSRPEYTGPILIRGEQIDDANALHFGRNGQELLAELELPAGASVQWLERLAVIYHATLAWMLCLPSGWARLQHRDRVPSCRDLRDPSLSYPLRRRCALSQDMHPRCLRTSIKKEQVKQCGKSADLRVLPYGAACTPPSSRFTTEH